MEKRKKRLTLEEYVDDPTADVDVVFGKKQKISSTEWDIVHYFYKRPDNIHYFAHDQKHEKLVFSNSKYVDKLIEITLNSNETVHLNESQAEYFSEKKDTYDAQKEAYIERKIQEHDEKCKKMFTENKPHCVFTYEKKRFEDENDRERDDENKIRCQRCGRHLQHTFVAQCVENWKKMVLGRECIKHLVPDFEDDWKQLKKEKKMQRTIKRTKSYIDKNKFDLLAFLKKAAITEASLIKQVLLTELTNPPSRDEDIIKKAIDTLCVLRLETMRTCFFEWKNRRFRLNNLSRLVASSETKKLKRSLKKWSRFVRSFKAQINFKKNTKDLTNVVISLLEQVEPQKECYLELSGISLSVHNGYSTYIKVYSEDDEILRTIQRIEEELRCTRLTVPSYPLTLKHTDRTVFCTSTGLLMKPCFNQVYENCRVSVLLKRYAFENTTGVSRVCVHVRIAL